ncbi:putative lipoprotein [plant metagenome]
MAARVGRCRAGSAIEGFMAISAVRAGVSALMIVLLAGCAGQRQANPAKPGDSRAATGAPPQPAQAPVCAAAPAAAGALAATWYAVSQQKGVKGEFRRLLVLSADGSYKMETRVQAGRNIRSELRESGCWEAKDARGFTTIVTRSNGELVDAKDPIYRNTYRVERVDGTRMVFREGQPGAGSMTARKMPAGYMMP